MQITYRRIWNGRPFALVGIALAALALSAPQQLPELIIRGGRVVTDEGPREADLRIRNGTIAEIGPNLVARQGSREIDASGLLVLPGGIDPHVHVAGNWADDYSSGSAAALAGGVTTIANFVPQRPGEEPGTALDAAEELVRSQAIADVMLHTTISDPATFNASWFSALTDRGQPSLKIYTYRSVFDQNPDGFLQLLTAARRAGVLTMIRLGCDGPSTRSHIPKRSAGKRGNSAPPLRPAPSRRDQSLS